MSYSGNLFQPQDRLDRQDYGEDQSDRLPGISDHWNNAYYNVTPTEYVSTVVPPGKEQLSLFQRDPKLSPYEYSTTEKFLIGGVIVFTLWFINSY
jgi:hypothetical protein